MGNKWTVLVLSLFVLLPLLNALPASFTLTSPATLFVEQPGTYTAIYTGDDSEVQLTPSEHNASCTYLYGENTSFPFAYNASTQSHQLELQYPAARNYSFNVTCSADGFDTSIIENATQEVIPAPTDTAFDGSPIPYTRYIGENLSIDVSYYSLVNNRRLTPDDAGQCNLSFYYENGTLIGEAALPFNNETNQFSLTGSFNVVGIYDWKAYCSAAPNFEPAESQLSTLEILPLPSLISGLTPGFSYFGDEAVHEIVFESYFFENENYSYYSLNPSDHNAGCFLSIDGEMVGGLEYNPATTTFDLNHSHEQIGNYNETVTCTALNYETSVLTTIHEVVPDMLPLSSLSFSYPTTLFVEEPGIYSAFFTMLPNESGGVTPLTPSEHNASCNYLYDNETLAMGYNTTSQNYELTRSYSAAGNYSFSITCNATSYESIDGDAMQEVFPLPSFISGGTHRFSYFGEDADHNIFFESYFLENYSYYPLNPSGHDASCFLSIDGEMVGGLEYNPATTTFDLNHSHEQIGNYNETVTCSALNYETSTLTTTHEVVPDLTYLIASHSTNVEDVALSVSYYASGQTLSDDYGVTCNASIYNNDTNVLVLGDIELIYNDEGERFGSTVPLSTIGTYYWDASCGGNPNYENATLLNAGEFYIEDPVACAPASITQDAVISADKTCSNNGGSPLYTIATDNITLNCNGATLTGIGSNSERIGIVSSGFSNVNIINCNLNGFSAAVWIDNSSNVSLRNISASGSGNSINIVDSKNTLVDNFTFTSGAMAGTPAVWIAGGENNIVSNGLVFNYDLALFAIDSNNTSITDTTINSVNTGLNDNGGTILRNVVFNNTYLALLLSGAGSVLQNVSIYNSPFDLDILATVAIASNNTVANIAVYNSTRDAVWLGGVNNSVSISATNVNGTALNLIEAVNNSVNLTSLSNNTLDINITGTNDTMYGNVFNGNFSSIFYNVTNSNNGPIAAFGALTLNSNGAIVSLNLTLFNTTGVVNLTGLASYFVANSTSVGLDSVAFPFLSQPAVITLTGVNYSDNSAYEILRNGAVCSDSICTKISSSPAATFRVTGFSNYTTRAVLSLAPSPAPAPAGGGGGGGGGGGSASPAAQTAVQNTTANATTQTPTSNQTTPQTRNNQVQQPQQNEQNTTNPAGNDQHTQPSPLTGLFAGIPKELNLYTAGAGVAVIALLGVGYLYFFKKHA